jgi:hypothetical protein
VNLASPCFDAGLDYVDVSLEPRARVGFELDD